MINNILLYQKSCSLRAFLISALTILHNKSVLARVCVRVRTHLSPAESTVTCSAGSNICCGSGDTVVHAEMASFFSANPCVLPLTSSPC